MTAEELRAWRVAHGMTQAALAEALGVPRNTVVRWENARHPIPKWLNVALSGVEANQATDPDDVQDFREALERMTPPETVADPRFAHWADGLTQLLLNAGVLDEPKS